VVGNCGFSPAPLTDASADTVRSRHGFFGSFVHDLDWRWRAYGDFASRLGAGGLAVVLDPATVCDLATCADPHRFPAGIEHVLVAGEVTVRGGRHTGARAGRVLRRP
jgi:N-acyl-D-aspartate/D-glutamate deacylase